MAILEKFEKQPGEVHYFDVHHEDFLAALGDTASTPPDVTWEDGITQPTTATFISPGVVRVWAAGGVDGVSYKATIKVLCDSGWSEENEIVLKVKER